MAKGKLRFNVPMPKALFLVTFLLVNSLTWLFIERRNLSIILDKIGVLPQQKLIIWGTWDLAIILSSIIGAIFSTKIKKFTFLCLWIILGIIASLLVYFLQYLHQSYILPISFLWGLSFGVGMPSCLAYFARQTTFENRGSLSGLIFFATSGITPLILMSGTSFALSLISLTWRIIGVIMLVLLMPKENLSGTNGAVASFGSILKDRHTMLYLIPWFMFSFIYGFQKVTIEQSLLVEFYDFLKVIQAVSAMISSILSGIICDRAGRKRMIIYGFISLGIAYAVVSIAQTDPTSLYFYSLIDGVSWGIFITLFVLTLWGDLSFINTKNAEKYYAVGSIPFFFADFTGFLFAAYVRAPIGTAFSIASFFLFLAVVPLMYAPETLPEKKLRERELRSYIEKAKKVKEKFT